MTNLFANALNLEAINNLTSAQADAVLAIFDKPTTTTETQEA